MCPEVVGGKTAPAQVLDDGLLERERRMVAADGHDPDGGGRRQCLGIHVDALAHHGDAPLAQCVEGEGRDVTTLRQRHGAAVGEHARVGLGD